MSSPEERSELDEQEEQRPVIRDRRRIDPATGEVRKPAEQPASAPSAGAETATVEPDGGKEGKQAEQVESLQAQLADAVADVQRVQAEYANYRKRVDRDRAAVREQALANVLGDLLPVLDDIGRAREHGELRGGFRQVAESLEQIVTKLGLVRFGEVGDPFDPTVHEALMHSYAAAALETTCAQILQPGYSLNERVLRPARVAVVEPDVAPARDQADSAEEQARATDDEDGSTAEQGDAVADTRADTETDGA